MPISYEPSWACVIIIGDLSKALATLPLVISNQGF
jgi:hypothetical protein